MSSHDNVKKGQQTESIAAEYLIRCGFQVLHTNWRSGRAEIDIIAKTGIYIVFVEVKSRSTDYFGAPERAVNAKKQRLLVAASCAYMDAIDYQGEFRFDIISIIFQSDQSFTIEHFEDAFFPK